MATGDGPAWGSRDAARRTPREGGLAEGLGALTSEDAQRLARRRESRRRGRRLRTVEWLEAGDSRAEGLGLQVCIYTQAADGPWWAELV